MLKRPCTSMTLRVIGEQISDRNLQAVTYSQNRDKKNKNKYRIAPECTKKINKTCA